AGPGCRPGTMPLASPGEGPGPRLDDPLAAIPHIDSDEDDAQDGRQAVAAPAGSAPSTPQQPAACTRAELFPPRSLGRWQQRLLAASQEIEGNQGHLLNRNEDATAVRHGVKSDHFARSRSAVAPKSIAELSERLLAGGVQLPGVHDVTGRPLVLYDAEASAAARVSSTELASTLCYFVAVARRDSLSDGVTLLAAVDVLPDCEQGQHRLRTLDEALCLLTPEAKLSSVLVCQTRPAETSTESSTATRSAARRGVLPLSDEQYHILGDSVAQRNFLTDGALPARCGGALRHDHAAWVAFYQELEPFLEACQSCGRGLASVMAQLADQQAAPAPAPAPAAQPGAPAPGAGAGVTPEKCNTSTQLQEQPDATDSCSLSDSMSGSGGGSLHSEQSALCRALSQPALLRLRREGPRALARLGALLQDKLAHSEDVRLALARARRLFAEVDRAAVRLEQLGESRRERLRTAARLRALHEETTQVLSWLTHTGEDSLQRHATMASTLPAIRQQELDFDKFYFVSMVSACRTMLTARLARRMPQHALLTPRGWWRRGVLHFKKSVYNL
ncbi:hypothetical protein KUF71_009144, partial [Frankliniella fusca]